MCVCLAGGSERARARVSLGKAGRERNDPSGLQTIRTQILAGLLGPGKRTGVVLTSHAHCQVGGLRWTLRVSVERKACSQINPAQLPHSTDCESQSLLEAEEAESLVQRLSSP